MASREHTERDTREPGHEYGALPMPWVTPERRGLIRSGRVFSLQHVMRPTMPQWAVQPAYALTPMMSHEQSESSLRRPATGAFERIEHSGHSGTHIDALCHVGCWHDNAAFVHGDIAVQGLSTPEGFRDLGAERFPPIVLRGVLLDVPAAKNLERLPDLYEVTASDLRACEERQGVRIAPDTAVLVRTGFESLWYSDPERYMGRAPGPGVDAARYLADRGAVVTGDDTANYELTAFPDLPVHVFLLYERGIPIIENLRLDELAAARAYEFLFIALPIAFAGATGSALHPIAIA